jgi:hypothetical protein
VENEILELKRARRSRWEGPMADAQRRHHALRRRATEVYVTIAFARGRLHVVKRPAALAASAASEAWDGRAHAAQIAERVLARLEKEAAA